MNNILEHAWELQEVKRNFDYLLKIGTTVEAAVKIALEAQGLKAKVIPQGIGSHDFEIQNEENGKSFFIELKSHAYGSSSPIKMAISQANKSMQNGDSFALCILKRPEAELAIHVDYIRANLRYWSKVKDILTPTLSEYNQLREMMEREGTVKLYIPLRESVKVSLEHTVLGQYILGFDELISNIQRQIN